MASKVALQAGAFISVIRDALIGVMADAFVEPHMLLGERRQPAFNTGNRHTGDCMRMGCAHYIIPP